MSAHGVKAKARHPDPSRFARECFFVAHVTFEIIDHPKDGATFALIAGDAVHAHHRRPLFTGHITTGMPQQLRALADRIERIAG